MCLQINAPPRPLARLRRLAARAGTPLRWFGWTPHHPSVDQAPLSLRQPAPVVAARRRVPARFARGGVGFAPRSITAAGAAQNAWAFCYCRRPPAHIHTRLGEHVYGDFEKTQTESCLLYFIHCDQLRMRKMHTQCACAIGLSDHINTLGFLE